LKTAHEFLPTILCSIHGRIIQMSFIPGLAIVSKSRWRNEIERALRQPSLRARRYFAGAPHPAASRRTAPPSRVGLASRPLVSFSASCSHEFLHAALGEGLDAGASADPAPRLVVDPSMGLSCLACFACLQNIQHLYRNHFNRPA